MNVELAYRKFGDSGPHLIILHGLFGTMDNWQTIAKKLAEQYRVTLFDLRNHGRSPHSEDFDVAWMASDVKYMMDRLSIPSATMIGHSMGAKVVMHFALAYAPQTEGMVSIDMSPAAYKRGHDDVFEALFAVDLDKVSSRSEVETILHHYIPESGTVQFLLKNLSRQVEDTSRFEWKMNLPVLYAQYDTILQPIVSENVYEGPVLFLKGGNSRYVQEQDEALIKALFPYAQIQSIPQAGHWVHADQPQLVTEALQEFVQSY